MSEVALSAWLDSWETRRLGKADPRIYDTPPAPPLQLADTMFILKHGKKAWRAAKAKPFFSFASSSVKEEDAWWLA